MPINGTLATPSEGRVLMLAPTDTDAAIAERVIVQAGLPLKIVRDVPELCAEASFGAGAVLLTEDAVLDQGIEPLAALIAAQPVWSDLPIVMLTAGGQDSPASAFALERLGNVLLLDYPVRVNNLISMLRVALRDRRRQYETRQYQDQLVQQAENLWRSNKELEQFAYVSSHDLKEPLRKILNYAQLLEQRYKGALEGDGDKYIHNISDGAERMRNLIEGLLAFSRLTKSELKLESVDLNRTVADVVNDLELSISDRTGRVVCGPLPVVTANALQMQQVMQNLIANALKFCEGCPEITVSAKDDEDNWIISVHDNGIGIDPLYRDRIFNVFARLHGRGQYPGTGIGLAICKKIVEAHRGRIWVESAPGKGATFHFTISKSLVQNGGADPERPGTNIPVPPISLSAGSAVA